MVYGIHRAFYFIRIAACRKSDYFFAYLFLVKLIFCPILESSTDFFFSASLSDLFII